jgi:CheY-like chemotaxis protein
MSILNTPKIIYFEDDKFLSEIIVKSFIKNKIDINHQPVYPNNIIEYVLKENPNLIITCMNMPQMTGFEAIKILKNDNRTKDIPIVIFTNMDQKEDREQAFKLGVSNYLIKAKCLPDEFVSKIKLILNN